DDARREDHPDLRGHQPGAAGRDGTPVARRQIAARRRNAPGQKPLVFEIGVSDAAGMSHHPFESITDLANRLTAEENFSGILHLSRGDEVLYESCHGLADRAAGTPVRSSTRFGTASLSKMFTAVAVVESAARGEVGLQDPVVEVLPDHKRPSTLRPEVTVHHLLSHTSGIADYFEEDEDLPGYQ